MGRASFLAGRGSLGLTGGGCFYSEIPCFWNSSIRDGVSTRRGQRKSGTDAGFGNIPGLWDGLHSAGVLFDFN